jgi:hypothetical protein
MPGSPFGGRADADKRPEAHGLFRKRFVLAQVPERVPARITADSRYLLFVNGREVYRGPVRSQPRRMHYDLFDLAPSLKAGENLIVVHVKYYGSANSYWIPAVPNTSLGKSGVLVFEANLAEAGWLVSDASWKAEESDAWTEPPPGEGPVGGGVPVELFDAGRFPSGWEQPGFDDAAWGSAVVIPAMHIGGFGRTQPPTDPYGPLYPRPIARLDGKICVPTAIRIESLKDPVDLSSDSPAKRVEASTAAAVMGREQAAGLPIQVTVPFGGAARLVMDMGRVVSGFPQFEVEAPRGTILDFAYVEDPIDGPGTGFGRQLGTRYAARGANDRFQVFDPNGLRYAYLLIHGVSGPVTLKSFSVQENLYPWTAGAGFECSDEALNRLFQAGIRTVQLNSQDAFLDCPTREQRAWVGDSVVHQMVHLAANLDWRLAWHYLALSNSPRSDGILPMSVAGEVEADGGHTIPDWALHWIHGVYNLYRFAGDREQVLAFMPTAARVLRWYAPFQSAQGLLKDVVEWNLVDWSSISNEDTSSVITALWARGLREFAEMAAWLGESASQSWAEDLYAKARAGFEALWDETRGSYVDHIVDGARRPEMSQLGGALAVVSGLAPEERWGRIVDTVTDPDKLVVRSWTGGEGDISIQKILKQMQGIYELDWNAESQIVQAQPFMSYVVHDAVAQAGRAGRLPELYRRWLQFLVEGYDTLGECWGWGSHAHGWSSTPTRDMVFYTLGVTPAEPGYTVARVAPRLGGLRWAKGKVPTPHGLITVSATGEKITVDSPVPLIVEPEGQAPQRLPAGHHEVKVG